MTIDTQQHAARVTAGFAEFLESADGPIEDALTVEFMLRYPNEDMWSANERARRSLGRARDAKPALAPAGDQSCTALFADDDGAEFPMLVRRVKGGVVVRSQRGSFKDRKSAERRWSGKKVPASRLIAEARAAREKSIIRDT